MSGDQKEPFAAVAVFVRMLRRTIDPDDGPAVASLLSRTAAALWIGGGGNAADFAAMAEHHAKMEIAFHDRKRREYWLRHAAELQATAARLYKFHSQAGTLGIREQLEIAKAYQVARYVYREATTE